MGARARLVCGAISRTSNSMSRRGRCRNDVKSSPRNRPRRFGLAVEALEPRELLTTFVVQNTGDSGPGTLRAAILAADADPSPGTDDIVFGIPASTAPELNVPVPGFDPGTQTWRITPASPLPTITRSLSIDG